MNPSNHLLQPDVLELTHACSRTDTDATEGDLPGPGRTLDNVYIAAGRHIEVLCGKAVKLLGRRSRLTAQNIRRVQEEADNAFQVRLGLESVDLALQPVACELSLVCSRDTNETADDLPGPGRTLGKLYDLAGFPIESFLSKCAETIGKGPRMTAQRIRRLRGEVLSATRCHPLSCRCLECQLGRAYYPDSDIKVERSPSELMKLSEKISLDCKRLLKYLRSKEPSTQKQALDWIINLSVDDLVVRALLKSNGATKIISDASQVYSKFRFSDADQLLLSSSRKALVSLGDAGINSLLADFIKLAAKGYLWDNVIAGALWNKISPYLNDPDYAFLVMRCLRKACLIENFDVDFVSSIMISIRDSSNYFEWEECGEIIKAVFWSEDCISSLIPISNWFFSHSQDMPRVIESTVVKILPMNNSLMEPYEFCHTHRIRYAIAEGIKSIVESDGLMPSPDALKHLYSNPPLEPFLDILACPLDHILRSFFGAFSVANFGDHVPNKSEKWLYDELVQYLNSSDPALRNRAWIYINYLSCLDVYRCEMMLEALSRTGFGASEEFSKFIEEKRMGCVPKSDTQDSVCLGISRHQDTNSNVYCYPASFYCKCSCVAIGHREQMKCPTEWTTKVPVMRGETFSKAGYFPLVTHVNPDGKCLYLAYVFFRGFACMKGSDECCSWPPLANCTVADGTRPEDLRVVVQCPHRKELLIPYGFEVLVLRYSPDALIRALGVSGERLFTTGPLSWKPDQKEIVYPSHSLRIITTEEAMASGERSTYEESLEDGEVGSELADDDGGDQESEFGSDSNSSAQEDFTEGDEEANQSIQTSCEDTSLPEATAGPLPRNLAIKSDLPADLSGLDGMEFVGAETDKLDCLRREENEDDLQLAGEQSSNLADREERGTQPDVEAGGLGSSTKIELSRPGNASNLVLQVEITSCIEDADVGSRVEPNEPVAEAGNCMGQIDQTSENCCEDLWHLGFIVPITVLSVFVLVLGTALGNFIFYV